MALTVEDGSGLSNSESFISVADADAYFTNRVTSAWTGSTTVKENALRKATDYMEAMYRTQWKGTRAKSAQALAWPRNCVYDEDAFPVANTVVPNAVKIACAEFALRSLASPLAPDDTTPNIRSESVSIPGPISESIEYVGSKSALPVYTQIERMLKPFLENIDVATRA